MGLFKKSLWNTLTIEQYQNIIQAEKRLTETSDLVKHRTSIVNIVYGVDETRSFAEVMALYFKVEKELSVMPKIKFTPYVWVQGKRYYVNNFFDEILTNQFTEVMTFGATEDQRISNLHKIMASLTCDMKWGIKRQKYNPNAHRVKSELFQKHMNVKTALSVSGFFLATWFHTLQDFQHYSQNQMMRKA